MLDKVVWKFFEKTGNIDIYLMYNDIKNTNQLKTAEKNNKDEADSKNIK
ncbi:MAG: YqzL family protein [Clostridiales bacterium]|nr:YqzL family protein [Clostridiales bacterium]HBM81253.1 YqzL family protein [Clostridiaceae bacterium]